MPHFLLKGAADKALQRQTGHFQRLLKREEHAGPGPLVGGFLRDVLPLKDNASIGYGVLGAAHQHIAQCGLARAVGAHQHMGFALADGQIHAVQKLFFLNPGRQPGNL